MRRTTCIHMVSSTSQTAPLEGVKILDLTSVVLGPFATKILASLGEQVLKVETIGGDTMRHVGPMKNAGMGHIFCTPTAASKAWC